MSEKRKRTYILIAGIICLVIILCVCIVYFIKRNTGNPKEKNLKSLDAISQIIEVDNDLESEKSINDCYISINNFWIHSNGKIDIMDYSIYNGIESHNIHVRGDGENTSYTTDSGAYYKGTETMNYLEFINLIKSLKWEEVKEKLSTDKRYVVTMSSKDIKLVDDAEIYLSDGDNLNKVDNIDEISGSGLVFQSVPYDGKLIYLFADENNE